MDIQLDKLGRDRAKRSGKSSRAASSRSVTSGGQKPAFGIRLLEIQRESLRDELDGLLEQIDTQAREIEKSLTFESLASYKGMVQRFIGIAINELYTVEEKLSVSPTGRKKSLFLVKKIDEELEKLTEEFMGRQRNLVAFLSRLDQIRGLLLDLYT